MCVCRDSLLIRQLIPSDSHEASLVFYRHEFDLNCCQLSASRAYRKSSSCGVM
jgi:hypothetical protein